MVCSPVSMTRRLIRLPDRVFGTEADAADTMFQLLRTVAEGKVGEADVRLARGAGGQGAPRWYTCDRTTFAGRR
jgi:hypothetical protein